MNNNFIESWSSSTGGRLRSDDNSFGDYHVTNYTTPALIEVYSLLSF